MFKIIARSKETNRQIKKRIYDTTKKFNTYSFELCSRYANMYIVEVYEMINEEYHLIVSFKTREEFNKMITDSKDIKSISDRDTFLKVLKYLFN